VREGLEGGRDRPKELGLGVLEPPVRDRVRLLVDEASMQVIDPRLDLRAVEGGRVDLLRVGVAPDLAQPKLVQHAVQMLIDGRPGRATPGIALEDSLPSGRCMVREEPCWQDRYIQVR